MADRILAIGRRKEATARVELIPGQGSITVNRLPVDKYFKRETDVICIKQPLVITNTTGKFDIVANVDGGGTSGQAGALRLGIARALVSSDTNLRQLLRRTGLLTRDARMKERKKYGQKGARKRFQWTKR
jgi:small subunit ribosomal protein S9